MAGLFAPRKKISDEHRRKVSANGSKAAAVSHARRKEVPTLKKVVEMLKEQRRIRVALLRWVKAQDGVEKPAGVSAWHGRDDDDIAEQISFIEDPPGKEPTPQVFRKYVLERALRNNVRITRMRHVLGVAGVNDYHIWQDFLNRPLLDSGPVEARRFIDLSVMLEVDVEVLLAVALEQERLHRVREIREAVGQGTVLTGPSTVAISEASPSEPPIPVLPKGR